MQQTTRQATKTRIFYVVIVCVGLACAVIGAAIGSRGVTAAELQEKLIDSCEQSRSPLQAYFNGEIAATQATDPSLFPDIDPVVFAHLVEEKVKRLQMLVQTFDPDTCAEQYSD